MNHVTQALLLHNVILLVSFAIGYQLMSYKLRNKEATELAKRADRLAKLKAPSKPGRGS